MSALAALKAATSLNDLAKLLRYKPKTLAYFVRVLPPTAKYTDFKIPKRSGGHRVISAPRSELKQLQRRLSNLLQDCLAEIELDRNVTVRIAHGFKRGSSITINASVHRRRRYVFNLDLADFFGTINFGRVRGYFVKNRDFALAPDTATLIAQIACHNNALPQGSPCSPVISNLIGNILDMQLCAIARATGCSYSRYADDLTFSTSKAEFPPEVAIRTASDPNLWQLGSRLARAIAFAGYNVNPLKTRMQYRRSRQTVTGIVVNKRVNTRSEYRRTARAMVHRLLTTGSFDIAAAALDASGQTLLASQRGTVQQLEGVLAHILNVDKSADRKEARRARSKDDDGAPKLTSNEKLLRDVVFYSYFASSGVPTIVTEGKTDQIHLTCAIKSLAAVFPVLATPAKPSPKLSLKFLRLTDRNDRLFHLGGGTGDLKKFLLDYRRLYQRVRAPKGMSPVIFVIDNDSGSKDLKNFVEKYLKITLTGKLSVHLFENVYLVLTPLKGGATMSCIEDCYTAHTLSRKLNGKSFNYADAIDPATEYGKQAFADKVVKVEAKTIDFRGFNPLLDEIASVVRTHASRHVLASPPVKAVMPVPTVRKSP